MTDRPILFSPPMVRALLDGRKTQTRRVLKDQPGDLDRPGMFDDGEWYVTSSRGDHQTSLAVRFRVGDRLWVRETWADTLSDPNEAVYRADGERPHSLLLWQPSIHMPRWASRLTLTVTDVRVQRLQDISEEDALAEGVIWSDEKIAFHVPGVPHPDPAFPWLSRATAREMYAALWDVINGAGSWGANPWVVALTFTVEQKNIGARP